MFTIRTHYEGGIRPVARNMKMIKMLPIKMLKGSKGKNEKQK